MLIDSTLSSLNAQNLPPSSHDETNNNNSNNTENSKSAEILPESCKEMTLVKFKNHLYYEEKDNFSQVEKKLTPLIGSKVKFNLIFKTEN